MGVTCAVFLSAILTPQHLNHHITSILFSISSGLDEGGLSSTARFTYSAFAFEPSPSLNRWYSSYACSLRRAACGWSSASGTCGCGQDGEGD